MSLEAGPEDSSAREEKEAKDEDLGYDKDQQEGEEYFEVELSGFHGTSTNIYPVPQTVLIVFRKRGKGFSFALSLLM